MQSRRIQNLFLIQRSSFDYGELDFIRGFELSESILNRWHNDRSFSRLQGPLTISINNSRNRLLLDHRNLNRHVDDDRRLNRLRTRDSNRKQSKHKTNSKQGNAERHRNTPYESLHAKAQRFTQKRKEKAEARLEFFSLCRCVS